MAARASGGAALPPGEGQSGTGSVNIQSILDILSKYLK
jgi:hypothetical protein